MDLLLDTQAFIWWQMQVPRLGPAQRAAIADGRNRIFVSTLAIWEIGLKRSLGKLDLAGSVVEAVERNRFELLPILPGDAERFETLPWHHRDPFDRMLIAQALERGLTIVTSDAAFQQYEARIWLS
ncbi:MAG TPA: type II toxin-antitoxin system VapC family toxin [Aliidongia sp.]|nr:type II toxin-antitoxin system VapC family toxin [Aliidongia sp.]